MSLRVTSVACPQSLPFAPLVLWMSSGPPSVTLPLLFPSSIHPPLPSPTPLCAACCPAAFIYRCTLQCLQHRSTSVCLVQQHYHTSSRAETLLTQKHTHTHKHTQACRHSHMKCKRKQWTGKKKQQRASGHMFDWKYSVTRHCHVCGTAWSAKAGVEGREEERQDDIITADTGAAGGYSKLQKTAGRFRYRTAQLSHCRSCLLSKTNTHKHTYNRACVGKKWTFSTEVRVTM